MRLPVPKTPKFFVGGVFLSSESGRTEPLRRPDGTLVGHIPMGSRSDLHKAAEAAAAAAPGWARRPAVQRGQILYRFAEMLEARAAEITSALQLDGTPRTAAAKQTAATIDRVVHYAGWADKFQQILGRVNPVASPHFVFSVAEPVGACGIVAPDQPALLGLLSLILPALTAGNTVVALASRPNPWPAILLGEILATSDLPAGVVNLLTGSRSELLPTFANHETLRVVAAVADSAERTLLETAAVECAKRLSFVAAEKPFDWFAPQAQGAEKIAAFTEIKTIWHPVG